MSKKLKPHDHTWDVMRVDNYTYIFRNDLSPDGTYCLRFEGDAGAGGKPEVFKVCDSLENGSHYLGFDKDSKHYKYIIYSKTNKYQRVSDVQTGADLGNVKDLHPAFIGGDHYCQRNGDFIMINFNKGKFYFADTLAEKPTDKEIRDDIMKLKDDIVAIWANGKYYYVLLYDKNTLQYKIRRLTSFSEETASNDFNIDDRILDFMPGGIGQVYDDNTPLYDWQFVFGYDNTSDTDTHINQTYNLTSGSSVSSSNTVEHNWNVGSVITTETEGSFGLAVIKAEASLSLEYGGLDIRTSDDSYQEEESKQTNIDKIVQAKTAYGLWQPKCGWGGDKLEFSKKGYTHLVETNSTTTKPKENAYDYFDHPDVEE